MEISSAPIDIWTIGLIAAGVVAGVVLIGGIICLSFYWEEKARRRARPATATDGTLERTEGGDWPTAHGDGAGGTHH